VSRWLAVLRGVIPVREEPTGAQLQALLTAAERAAVEEPLARNDPSEAIALPQQDVTKGGS
jgi:hypothetical protein